MREEKEEEEEEDGLASLPLPPHPLAGRGHSPQPGAADLRIRFRRRLLTPFAAATERASERARAQPPHAPTPSACFFPPALTPLVSPTRRRR